MAKKWKGMVLPDIKLPQQPQKVDFFSSQAERDDEKFGERRAVSPSSLFEFKDHPFEIRDDEEMAELMDSISNNGILTPIIVRPRVEGGYEIISGHRRCYAARQLNLEEVPVIIRNYDDFEAIIKMVECNVQREHFLPMEKARAYKMEAEALKHQGERNDLTSCHNGRKLETTELMAMNSPDSARQISRYMVLNNLIPELQDLVDKGTLKMTPASEIAGLHPEEQADFLDYIETQEVTPTVSQAQKLKKASQEGALDIERLEQIMSNKKISVPPREEMLNIRMSEIKGFFPKTYSKEQMERHIVKVLSEYFSRLEREKSEQEHEV